MLKQELYLKLQQKLSPQQIQLMKLVQLPVLAFEQRIKQELEENPALEDQALQEEEFEQDEFSNQEEEFEVKDEIDIEQYLTDDDIPEYKTQINNYSSDTQETSIPYAGAVTLYEYLTQQLYQFDITDDDLLIAEFLIGSIDEDGYIRRPLETLSEDLLFTQNIEASAQQLDFVLTNYIHRLEPLGIGARSLQECLLIQLKQREEKDANTSLAYKIIIETFDEFTKKHYEKIIKFFGISEETLRLTIREIEKLNPKPGKSFHDNLRTIEHITPDFNINIVDGELDLRLNSGNLPELRLSSEYKNLLETYKEGDKKDKDQKETVIFIKQKLDAAKWFIDAVKQRENTLMLAMSTIMKLQEEYFLTGDETKIRPMILKDIADKIQMDVSTISRVANSKYVNTPYGTLLVKDLFSESMTNLEGEEVSTREIKNILKTSVDNESKKKPLTDEKLSALLEEKGYKVARRTIAKYREQMNIPVARLRKKL